MLKKILFKQIDNSGLIVFRICFGFLLFVESLGSIFTGWVQKVLIAPQFTFNFIGFDFLQPLPGVWMYVYYVIMGVLGIFVMLGFKYRFSILLFTFMWTCVYLMHKESYNNHYYLLILLCVFMSIAPAHHYFSIDARRNPTLRKISMPRWIWLFIIFQLTIVFTFAATAKLYPDWLNGTLAKIILESRTGYPVVGYFFEQEWTRVFLTYFAIFFDLLFVPFMLWKRTRLPMFILAIFFHLFNSIIFQIGIFPYLSLAFCLFFFPTTRIQHIFLPHKLHYSKGELLIPKYKKALVMFLSAWFLIQIFLPLRHWVIKDNVLWTEEGHRLSWRMMLRSKNGKIKIRVVNDKKNRTEVVQLKDYLTSIQINALSSKPDLIWQFCQRLKAEYAEKGEKVEIFVDCKISINRQPLKTLINPNVDMAQAKWDYFFHNEWILPSKLAE